MLKNILYNLQKIAYRLKSLNLKAKKCRYTFRLPTLKMKLNFIQNQHLPLIHHYE